MHGPNLAPCDPLDRRKTKLKIETWPNMATVSLSLDIFNPDFSFQIQFLVSQ